METNTPDRRFGSVERRLSAESIARYVKGAPEESSQFDFFIGRWDCDVTLHAGSAATPAQLTGLWEARWTHERRLLVDDLSVFLPDGTEILGWVNLRTFCADSGCWEIMGQRALEAAAPVRTMGRWREGEMHLAFETPDAAGVLANRVRFHDITADSWRWLWMVRAASAAEEAPWVPLATILAKRAETAV